VDFESALVAECFHAHVALDSLLPGGGADESGGKLLREGFPRSFVLHINGTSPAADVIFLTFFNVVILLRLFGWSGQVKGSVELHGVVGLFVFLHVGWHWSMHAGERKHWKMVRHKRWHGHGGGWQGNAV